MTQEDKELLLKDFCARLSYGVKVAFFNEDLTYHSEPKTLTGIECINNLNYSNLEDEDGNTTIVEFVKPYLFPLSSMTDEMLEELNANGFFKYRGFITNVSHLVSNGKVSEEIYTYIDIENISFLMEFFYSHHIDFRCFIEKGLALDATGLGIY